MEALPKAIAEAYKEIYGNHPLFAVNDWWYQRFIKYYIEAGIPEKGIVGILEKHPVPQAMVKQYGATTGLVPEKVARNILEIRHEPMVNDSLATPKIRVTKKQIADYRRALETELRRIYKPVESLEETVKRECYDATDEDIARKIRMRMSPESWASQVNEWL